MRRLLTVVLLAIPLASVAQYPPPYGYPPPPPPPPRSYAAPYAAPHVAPHVAPLSPFYFNLGVGYGIESWYGSAGYAGVGGLTYHVEAGARLMPQLLLGFDLSGLSTFGNAPGGGTAGVTILDYDVVATLFPFVRGLFLRGGAGLSTLTSVPASTVGVSYLGPNLLLGAGWAFPVGYPLHLTLGLDWAHPFFGASDVTGMSVWMFRAGFGLY